MAGVKVLFFGGLRGITGTHELDLDLEGRDTVGEALDALIHRFGEDFRNRIIDPVTGNPRKFILITVNERDIRHLQRLETKLGDGDQISFLPAVAGGLARSIYHLQLSRAHRTIVFSNRCRWSV